MFAKREGGLECRVFLKTELGGKKRLVLTRRAAEAPSLAGERHAIARPVAEHTNTLYPREVDVLTVVYVCRFWQFAGPREEKGHAGKVPAVRVTAHARWPGKELVMFMPQRPSNHPGLGHEGGLEQRFRDVVTSERMQRHGREAADLRQRVLVHVTP
jgi:hypothetical protein